MVNLSVSVIINWLYIQICRVWKMGSFYPCQPKRFDLSPAQKSALATCWNLKYVRGSLLFWSWVTAQKLCDYRDKQWAIAVNSSWVISVGLIQKGVPESAFKNVQASYIQWSPKHRSRPGSRIQTPVTACCLAPWVLHL